MCPIIYTVTATLPDEQTCQTYLAWLEEGHVRAVLAGGAIRGEVVRLQGSPLRVRSSYEFPDQAAFDAYERDAAPALREDGTRRFGALAGVTFERTIGHRVFLETNDPRN